METYLNQTFEEWCDQLDKEAEQLRLDYDITMLAAERLLDRNMAEYQVKEHGKWITVSKYSFNRFNGFRKVNGRPFIGKAV